MFFMEGVDLPTRILDQRLKGLQIENLSIFAMSKFLFSRFLMDQRDIRELQKQSITLHFSRMVERHSHAGKQLVVLAQIPFVGIEWKLFLNWRHSRYALVHLLW